MDGGAWLKGLSCEPSCWLPAEWYEGSSPHPAQLPAPAGTSLHPAATPSCCTHPPTAATTPP